MKPLFPIFALLAFAVGSWAQVDEEVARKGKAILKRNCVLCHAGSKPAGDLDLNDPRLMANALATEEQRKEVVEAILDKPMPPDEDGWKRSFERNYDVSEERLKDLQLSDAEVETLTTWIKGYRPDEGPNRPHLSHPKLVEAILADAKILPARHRAYQRYLSISNLYNAGDSDENLEIYRKAIRKLLNSLTWYPEIQKFAIVPDTKDTILRFDLRGMEYPKGKNNKKWDAKHWEFIASFYPYFLPVRTPAATELKRLIGTDHYFLRADWFAFALSRPPLYHQILGLPESLDELEETLGVKVANNIDWTLSPEGDDSPMAIRAGTTISRVSSNHRIIERHPLTRWRGAYWLSYDFRTSEAKGSPRDVRERPLGPKGKNAFQHDGGEVIFNLPNGMQAYYLATSKGERLDVAPTDIVQNYLRADGKVINGVSCIACHAAGMNPIKAEVRKYVLNTSDDAETRSLVKRLYPGQKDVDELLERDKRKFTKASADAGALHPGVEPVSKLVERFERRVTLDVAAAELDKTPEELRKMLDLFSSSKAIRALETQLSSSGMLRTDFIGDFNGLRKKLFDEEFGFKPLPPLVEKPLPKKPRVPRGEKLTGPQIDKLNEEASALHDQGKYREGKAKTIRAFEAHEKSFELSKERRIIYLRVLCKSSNRLQENDEVIQRAIEISILAEEYDDRAFAYELLGSAYRKKGDYDKAIGYYEKSLAIKLKTLGPEHPDLAITYNNLGTAYVDKGEHDKAIGYYEKSLAIKLKTLGPEHPDLATSYNNLGGAYDEKGEYDKAIGYYEKSLAIDLKTLGPEHPDLATSYNNLGVTSDHKGEHDKAIGYYEKSLAIELKTLGPEHPYVAITYNNLGTAYADKGEHDKAIGYYEKSLAIELKTLGPEHPSVATTYNNLGSAYADKGEHDKAIGYYEKSLAIKLKTLGPEHPDLAITYNNLGTAYADKGEHDKAIGYFEKSLAIDLKTLGPEHPDVAITYNNLGVAYADMKNKTKALEYLLKAKAIFVDKFGTDHPNTKTTQSWINSLK